MSSFLTIASRVGAALALLFVGLGALADGHADTGVEAALAGAHRSDENRARDASRHPAETLAFFGLRPDMTVVELFPGSGWYTELLAPVLREKGKLIAAHYGEESGHEYRVKLYRDYVARLAEQPDVYDGVEVIVYNPPDQNSLGPDGSADMVLTFRSTHGLIRADTADDFFAAAFRVLRPGGVLGVVQHRAPAGADPAESAQKGYVPQAHVEQLAAAAGFELGGSSEVNANPRDTKDYEMGVWTLPPVLRKGDEDREKYLAIGESDRMTLRFVKPKA